MLHNGDLYRCNNIEHCPSCPQRVPAGVCKKQRVNKGKKKKAKQNNNKNNKVQYNTTIQFEMKWLDLTYQTWNWANASWRVDALSNLCKNTILKATVCVWNRYSHQLMESKDKSQEKKRQSVSSSECSSRTKWRNKWWSSWRLYYAHSGWISSSYRKDHLHRRQSKSLAGRGSGRYRVFEK